MSRRRGYLWFAAGLLLALTAGMLAFAAMRRATSLPVMPQEPAPVPVLVAARDIPAHSVVSTRDVVVRQVPPEIVPQGALTDPGESVGQLATAEIAQGEFILGRRLITPDYVGPRAAFAMDPNKVMVAFPTQDLLNSVGMVRPGDRVDLLFTLDFAKVKPEIAPTLNTLCVMQDLQVASVLYAPAGNQQQTVPTPLLPGQQQEPAHGPPQALLLAVDPQDALAIKFFRDAGAAADLALRSPAAEGPFDVKPVDGDYVLERYQIRCQVKG